MENPAQDPVSSENQTPHPCRPYKPVLFALLAALLFGLNAPMSKLLVQRIHPLFLASLLYIGAGLGMLAVSALRRFAGATQRESSLTRRELPFVVLMILLDIAAPVLMMFGLTLTSSSTAALLSNFEIAATAIFALLLFKESIGKRLWIAIGLITAASILLSTGDLSGVRVSPGALLVLLACVCWGIENNTTRRLSIKDPLQIVVIKGFGSGLGALLIALAWGSISAPLGYILAALLLGFVAYGLSIFFYVSAQRDLGAARTSVYYASAPFIGVVISWIVFRDTLSVMFLAALGLMLLGTWLAATERHGHLHRHLAVTHAHRHGHTDGHHTHLHADGFSGEHNHEHTHEPVEHDHAHLPDEHHRHEHHPNGYLASE